MYVYFVLFRSFFSIKFQLMHLIQVENDASTCTLVLNNIAVLAVVIFVSDFLGNKYAISDSYKSTILIT